MKTPSTPMKGIALAAALAAALAVPALAQPSVHGHDGAAPHELRLDHGRKWATDAPLRAGMTRIRGLVEPQLAAAHAGKLSEARYREPAARVETEVGGIVANCRLAPEADAMFGNRQRPERRNSHRLS